MTMLLTIAATCVFFSCLVFLATYHMLAPWWRTQTGVNIVVTTSAIMGYAVLRLLVAIFGDGYWGQDALRVLLNVTIAAVMAHRWVLLIRAQVGPRGTSDQAASPTPLADG